MTDNIILIGTERVLEVTKEERYVGGVLIPGGKIADLKCILNPMSSKFLQNFESGQYTMQDKVAYSKQFIKEWQGADVLVPNKLGELEKFRIDDVISWDDSDLIKYLLKRGIDGQ